MDVIRDLKRINGHLASVAYPILEAAGELADTAQGRAGNGTGAGQPDATSAAHDLSGRARVSDERQDRGRRV